MKFIFGFLCVGSDKIWIFEKVCKHFMTFAIFHHYISERDPFKACLLQSFNLKLKFKISILIELLVTSNKDFHVTLNLNLIEFYGKRKKELNFDSCDSILLADWKDGRKSMGQIKKKMRRKRQNVWCLKRNLSNFCFILNSVSQPL